MKVAIAQSGGKRESTGAQKHAESFKGTDGLGPGSGRAPPGRAVAAFALQSKVHEAPAAIVPFQDSLVVQGNEACDHRGNPARQSDFGLLNYRRTPVKGGNHPFGAHRWGRPPLPRSSSHTPYLAEPVLIAVEIGRKGRERPHRINPRDRPTRPPRCRGRPRSPEIKASHRLC